MQVYLPDDLYRAAKEEGLKPSKLLQEAVRVELHRRRLLEATDSYLAGLVADVGEPDAEDLARAEALAHRIARRIHRDREAS
ncbi:MAG: hypothetical protein OXF41_04160 [bacterium]|nr:hypothetical protein [bacterium]